MRGKLYSYKTPVPRQPPAVNTGHMNLAAYQAFALQQRALLQHALSYESLMQNAAVAVTAPHFMPRPEHLHHAMAMTKQSDVTVTTSTPTTNNAHLHQPRLPPDERDPSFKIEQVIIIIIVMPIFIGEVQLGVHIIFPGVLNVEKKSSLQGIFFHSLGAKCWPNSQCKKPVFFTIS